MLKQIKEFGLGFTFKYYMYSALNKISKKYYFKRNNLIDKYLQKHYGNMVDSTISNVYGSPNQTQYVWVFWWQGGGYAPQIVQKCINSLKQHTNKNIKLVIIDKDNYKDYVNLPEYIINKVNDKIITLTHLSDILRVCLLSKYGGLWADATIFAIDDKLNGYLSENFFTIKKADKTYHVSGNRWAGYFLKTNPNNYLVTCMRDIFFKYHKDHNMLIHYFLIDHVVNLIYNNNAAVKKMIDDVPLNNPNIERLAGEFNNPYSEEEWQKLKNNTHVFKLSWKEKYVQESNGSTLYNEFLKDNLK